MKRFKQVSHTADKAIKIEADSLQGLFEAGLEGMASLQKESGNDEFDDEQTFRIVLEASDPTALLVDFLSEVLTLSDIHNRVFYRVLFEQFDNNQIKANLYGRPVNQFDDDIKAVTHYLADIKKRSDGILETIIVFDI